MMTKQSAGKTGELCVFIELLKRGAIPFLPLVDEGVDALVRTPSGRLIEVQIKFAGGAGGKYPRWFQVSTVAPRTNFFIVGVEAKDGEPGDVWIFPSAVFDKYASRPPKGSPRDLDLDIGTRKYGMALKDLLCGFRNRWELIIAYEQYEHLMDATEDLEDVLTMREALEAPKEEAITLGEYEHRRSAALSS